MQKLWKSVKIWQSCREFKGETQCSSQYPWSETSNHVTVQSKRITRLPFNRRQTSRDLTCAFSYARLNFLLLWPLALSYDFDTPPLPGCSEDVTNMKSVGQSVLKSEPERDRHTHRDTWTETDATERIPTPHSRAIKTYEPIFQNPGSSRWSRERAASMRERFNELSQRLVRYCSVEDATLEGAVCCRW